MQQKRIYMFIYSLLHYQTIQHFLQILIKNPFEDLPAYSNDIFALA